MAEAPKKQYELVAEKIIEQLKEGTAPWQRPWTDTGVHYTLPYNAVTGNTYKGLNSLYLNMFSPFEDPRWATFKQAKAEGWSVMKGAKGFLINFVKTHDLRNKLDDKKRPVLDEKGKPVKVRVQLANPIITKAWVFNAEQINGIPKLEVKEQSNADLWERLERVEKIIQNSQAKINHTIGAQAYYVPSLDKIQLPERNQFDSSAKYYATLLHELGHWTGHESRLNRDLKSGSVDKISYAREELRAEIASMMLGSELNIGHDPSQHLSYVDSWIKILTDTPQEILSASADAQRINDFIMKFEHSLELKKEQKQDLEQNLVEKEEAPSVSKEETESRTVKFKR